MEVEIIHFTNIKASPMERAVIVVKMYFQTLKTDDIVFNGKRHNLSDVILSNHFKHQSHSGDTDNMIQ